MGRTLLASPECDELFQKFGRYSCKCGKIFVDDGMLRIVVENREEEKVRTYYAYKKPDENTHNKRMQPDFGNRYAIASATDARRYV